jgi:hypothetical protein
VVSGVQGLHGKYCVAVLTIGDVRVRFRRAKGTLIVLSSPLSDANVNARWCGEDTMSL